jgi:hypothetical protein
VREALVSFIRLFDGAPAARHNRRAHDRTGDMGAADSLAIKYTEIPSKSGAVATPGK